jgi:hypothetical protein
MTERPQLLLIYSDSTYAVTCARYFRRQGWEVHLVTTASEAFVRAESLRPNAIVFETHASQRACAQVAEVFPDATLICVAGQESHTELWRNQHGSALHFDRTAGVAALAKIVIARTAMSFQAA